MDDEHVEKVAALERQLADAEQRIETLRQQLPTRRNMLRLGGAAALGAAAAVVGKPGVAAAGTGPMQYGASNSAGGAETRLSSSNDVSTLRVNNSGQGGRSIDARNSSGGTAVYAFTEPAGVNARGVDASVNGSNGYALVVTGGKSQVFLSPGFVSGPGVPGSHSAGELAMNNNTLWFCVVDGNPGTWRKLAAADTAGSFHPIATARVYDSRWVPPLAGVITGLLVVGGTPRLVSCDDKRALNNGAVTLNDVVPIGATAIAYNLTVTRTDGQGFLTVEPGGTAVAGGSAINWSPGQASLANASVAKLDTQRRVSVFIGGGVGASTHFIIDVVGFYR